MLFWEIYILTMDQPVLRLNKDRFGWWGNDGSKSEQTSQAKFCLMKLNQMKSVPNGIETFVEGYPEAWLRTNLTHFLFQHLMTFCSLRFLHFYILFYFNFFVSFFSFLDTFRAVLYCVLQRVLHLATSSGTRHVWSGHQPTKFRTLVKLLGAL